MPSSRGGTAGLGGLVVACGLLLGGVYTCRELGRLRLEIARLTEELPSARVFVRGVELDPKTGVRKLSLVWTDTDENWEPHAGAQPRVLTVYGQDVYFDSYQIIFDADLVRRGDPLRGRALTLFARCFGSQQYPDTGAPIHVPADVLGIKSEQESAAVPSMYRLRGHGPSFWAERLLWARLWRCCHNTGAAKRYGVRATQGTAVHKVLLPGREYRLSITRQGQIILDGPFHVSQ